MQMGANVTMGDDWIDVRGIGHDHGKLEPIDMDFNLIPDAAMTIAVAALFANGTSTLRNIASWRVKETDRIAAMATELRKVGAIVEEGPDYLVVTPPEKLTPNAAIDTYDDHRMAMCFARQPGRRARADQRSEVRRQDVPRLFRPLRRARQSLTPLF